MQKLGKLQVVGKTLWYQLKKKYENLEVKSNVK